MDWAITVGGSVWARAELPRGLLFFCPVCTSPVQLVAGAVRTPHFRHDARAPEDCKLRVDGDGQWTATDEYSRRYATTQMRCQQLAAALGCGAFGSWPFERDELEVWAFALRSYLASHPIGRGYVLARNLQAFMLKEVCAPLLLEVTRTTLAVLHARRQGPWPTGGRAPLKPNSPVHVQAVAWILQKALRALDLRRLEADAPDGFPSEKELDRSLPTQTLDREPDVRSAVAVAYKWPPGVVDGRDDATPLRDVVHESGCRVEVRIDGYTGRLVQVIVIGHLDDGAFYTTDSTANVVELARHESCVVVLKEPGRPRRPILFVARVGDACTTRAPVDARCVREMPRILSPKERAPWQTGPDISDDAVGLLERESWRSHFLPSKLMDAMIDLAK